MESNTEKYPTNQELNRMLRDLQEKVNSLEFHLEGLRAEQERLRNKVERRF